jgi:hypothetical protein
VVVAVVDGDVAVGFDNVAFGSDYSDKGMIDLGDPAVRKSGHNLLFLVLSLR